MVACILGPRSNPVIACNNTDASSSSAPGYQTDALRCPLQQPVSIHALMRSRSARHDRAGYSLTHVFTAHPHRDLAGAQHGLVGCDAHPGADRVEHGPGGPTSSHGNSSFQAFRRPREFVPGQAPGRTEVQRAGGPHPPEAVVYVVCRISVPERYSRSTSKRSSGHSSIRPPCPVSSKRANAGAEPGSGIGYQSTDPSGRAPECHPPGDPSLHSLPRTSCPTDRMGED